MRFKGIRSNWSKTNFRRNAVKWWFLYVIWCVESNGERILSIRLLVLEISSSKVDFFANTLSCIFNVFGNRNELRLFVFLYVFWRVEFNGERILSLGPSVHKISSSKGSLFLPILLHGFWMDSVIEMNHDCLFFPMYFDELNLMVKKFWI